MSVLVKEAILNRQSYRGPMAAALVKSIQTGHRPVVNQIVRQFDQAHHFEMLRREHESFIVTATHDCRRLCHYPKHVRCGGFVAQQDSAGEYSAYVCARCGMELVQAHKGEPVYVEI